MKSQFLVACVIALGIVSAARGQSSEAVADQAATTRMPVMDIPVPAPVVVPAPAPPPPAPFSSEPLRLSGSRLYVYNFLDWQDGSFTDKVIQEFDRQVAAWLGAKAQSVTISHSAELPLIKQMREQAADNWTTSLSGSQLRQSVPVIEAIQSNKEAEEAVSADYRLVIFPSSFTSSGSWRYYTLRWVVYRVSDNRSWQYLYNGSHLVMLKESERADSRSRKFIEAADQAMKGAGLFAG
jgi:hypothetical protein